MSRPATRAAVFLDRDGVITRTMVRDGRPYPPRGTGEMEILPGVERACRSLKEAGYLLVVVTNQPDVARGTLSRQAVEAMHEVLIDRLPLDDIYVCYHDDADACRCRKPKPGMLQDAAAKWAIDLRSSYMVGDRWRDVEAGRRAGCSSILVDNGYSERLTTAPDHRVSSLADAAALILDVKGGVVQDLRVKLFADGAELSSMLELYRNPLIKGFTTNPTLMREAGITDYRAFARQVLASIPDRPISFEVFADDFDQMRRQALEISQWGENVYVKVPITNTLGTGCHELIADLSGRGVKLNVTAMTTLGQIQSVVTHLARGAPAFVSLFAGRIADTGVDPMPMVRRAVELLRPFPHLQLIWASPREILNIFQADDAGCHIITVGFDLLKKLPLIGKDLEEYSRETVKIFYEDGRKAGFSL